MLPEWGVSQKTVKIPNLFRFAKSLLNLGNLRNFGTFKSIFSWRNSCLKEVQAE